MTVTQAQKLTSSCIEKSVAPHKPQKQNQNSLFSFRSKAHESRTPRPVPAKARASSQQKRRKKIMPDVCKPCTRTPPLSSPVITTPYNAMMPPSAETPSTNANIILKCYYSVIATYIAMHTCVHTSLHLTTHHPIPLIPHLIHPTPSQPARPCKVMHGQDPMTPSH
jgi:hypothetical protein